MPASKLGNDEPDLPFIDLYDSNAAVAPTNTTRIRRSGNLLQISTDCGAYVTIATGSPGANNRQNIDEPPLPFLDITDGGEGPGPINRIRIVRLAGNLSATLDGGLPFTIATGTPGANNILSRTRPMELVDVWDSGAPVAPVNTMRLARVNGALLLSTDSGAYGAITASPPGTPLLWFDGDDMDALGTHNASLTNGAALVTWKNKGSGGATYDAGQPTPSRRALLNKTAQAGKGGLPFDGTLTEYNLATNLPSTACTILVVLYSVGANAATAALLAFQNPSIYMNLSGGANNWSTLPGTTINSGTTLTNTPVILSLDLITAANVNMVTNGVAVNFGTGTNLTTGRGASVIGSAGSVQNSAVGICEILLYDPSLSAVNRKAAEAYLSAKWAIAVTP